MKVSKERLYFPPVRSKIRWVFFFDDSLIENLHCKKLMVWRKELSKEKNVKYDEKIGKIVVGKHDKLCQAQNS